MKLAFGIIVYNGDFVLWECLKSIYPYAHQILISEGCVEYYAEKGFTGSTDQTNHILDTFPDPENKITVIHGVYKEKTEQCNAYMKHLDADYLWQIDSDEIYRKQDIETIIELMPKYTSIGVCSTTFFGGFNHTISGFEANVEYKRIFKVTSGSQWASHRPPSIDNIVDDNHLSAQALKAMGITMFHYSYVWDRQVKDKIEYYKAKISKDNCIDDYFNRVYLPWKTGNQEQRDKIEQEYDGVHEFKSSYIGESFTEPFTGNHPIDINKLHITQ